MVDSRPIFAFVRTTLPPPPATVLEVGAGSGDLARALVDRCYDVTAIDPIASDDGLVRPVTLEAFDPDARYDAILANRTLHHIGDLEDAVATIDGLLVDDGRLMLNGFGWDRVDERTGRWLYDLLDAATDDRPVGTFRVWYEQWQAEHTDLHGAEEMLAALRECFDQRAYAVCPYLAEEYVDDNPEAVRRETTRIRKGEINAAGFRFVGRRRSEDGRWT